MAQTAKRLLNGEAVTAGKVFIIKNATLYVKSATTTDGSITIGAAGSLRTLVQVQLHSTGNKAINVSSRGGNTGFGTSDNTCDGSLQDFMMLAGEALSVSTFGGTSYLILSGIERDA